VSNNGLLTLDFRHMAGYVKDVVQEQIEQVQSIAILVHIRKDAVYVSGDLQV
jgi:hypothetical protein